MGMTLTEKIFANHSAKDRVLPGEMVWVDADVLMTHDVCGPGTIGVFRKHFGPDAKVFDPEKVVIIPDHYIFTATTASITMATGGSTRNRRTGSTTTAITEAPIEGKTKTSISASSEPPDW